MSERHVFIPRGDGVSTCKAFHGNDRDPVHASPALLKAERDISDLQEQNQSLQQQVEALQAELKSSDEMYEAQQLKFEGCPHQPYHGACGCSYDAVGDTCAVHAPALRVAQQQVTRLTAALEQIPKAIDRFQDIISGQPGESRNKLVVDIRDEVANIAGAALSSPVTKAETGPKVNVLTGGGPTYGFPKIVDGE